MNSNMILLNYLLMLYHYLLCYPNSIHGMLDVFDEPVPWYLGWRRCQIPASKKSIIDYGTSPLQEKEWWIAVIHWRASEVDQIIAWPAPIQGKYLPTSINNHNINKLWFFKPYVLKAILNVLIYNKMSKYVADKVL